MNVARLARSFAAFFVIAVPMAPAAQAAELRLLSAGAVELGLVPVLAAFQKATGHVVQVEFAAAPAFAARFAAGPPFDAVIATEPVLGGLARAGSLEAARTPVGRVGIGIAVRPGAEAPDIATAEALKQALLSADSVVFNRASTGLYIETMLGRLGVAAAVNAKAVRYADGAAVMKHLLASRAPNEFGFGAVTEIVLFEDQGLRLVGPLPAALQNHTGYVGALAGRPDRDRARADAADALLRFLGSSDARSIFANAGIEPLPRP